MPVSEYQLILKSLGMYTGKVDGIKGPLTIAALRGFQRVNNLKVDAKVGPKTVAALKPGILPANQLIPISTYVEPPTANVWPRQATVGNFYGQMGTHLTLLELPFKMRLAWNKNISISKFSIHEKVHDSALRCFNRIRDHYSMPQLTDMGVTLYGGCIADPPRKMRGGSLYSMHSYGIAIDFDPARNTMKGNRTNSRLAKPDCNAFWEIWEDEGWISLGRARNFDWMHVQAARL
jgi:hypothetical protein